MGDFQERFLRPDSGINTVEGNVAGQSHSILIPLPSFLNVCICCSGSRAAELSKKREAEQKLFEGKEEQ